MQHCTSITDNFAESEILCPVSSEPKGSLISEVLKQAEEHLAHDLSDYNELYPELK